MLRLRPSQFFIIFPNLCERVHFAVLKASIQSLITKAYKGPLNFIIDNENDMQVKIEEIFKFSYSDSA